MKLFYYCCFIILFLCSNGIKQLDIEALFQQLVVDEGATKCDSSDPQTITGTYSLNTDNTQLTVSSSASSEVYNIQTLNSTTLKLEQISNDDIITYTKIP